MLLMPENPKYEPIQLSDNQANIVGMAIGLLKKEIKFSTFIIKIK